MYKLYHYFLCPFCRIIRIYFQENHIQFESLNENIWEVNNLTDKKADFFNLPLIIDEKNEIIYGYRAILLYLENAHKKTLCGKNLKEKIAINQVLEWFDNKFYSEVYCNLVYEKVIKRQEQKRSSPDSNAIRMGMRNVNYHIEIIGNIFETRDWMAENCFSIADIAVAAHISCIDYLGTIVWEKFPFAKDWYAKMKSRPSFKTILEDRIPNVEPYENYDKLDF